MKIPHYSELKQQTDAALARARDPKKAILAYAGIICLLGLLVSILNMLVDHQFTGTGGLANLGLRSVLSTVQSVLPLAHTCILLCLELGYISAAMRFARKQYADHTDLKTGFRLFGPLLRLILLQTLVFTGIMMAAYYVGLQLCLLTPLGQPLLDAVMPYAEAGTVPDLQNLDPQLMDALIQSMIPMLAVILVLFALVAIPLSYRYRMANYYLVDHPRQGALAALRNSRRMMRGNCFRLFQADLHFWHYYLLTFLAMVICYGDTLLPLVGIELPMSDTLAYFLFYALYLVIQFFLYLGFRNRVEVTYVTAYDAIRPQEDDGSVVLGNIFDMAQS